MAKAKLTAAAAEWVKKKGPREKAQAQSGDKDKLTVYISAKASKLLWTRRAETGIPLSRTIEDLVLKHLGA